jgi:hypothetical protein
MASPFNLEPIGDVLFEAVTLTEMKKHMRVMTSKDDDYITDTIIPAARQQAEKDLNLALVGQAYKLHLMSFLNWHYYRNGQYYEYPYANSQFEKWRSILIPIQPVVSVTSITYTDPEGNPQTFDPSNYVVKTYTDPPSILITGNIPGIQALSEVVVTFTAGYTDEDDTNLVPTLAKQAIQLLGASWYAQREGTSNEIIRTVPLSYQNIISLLQVKRFH